MSGVSAERLIYVVAGEPSGDALGAGLMRALREETDGAVAFAGVGGDGMAGEGLVSLFPMDDLAVMGLAEVVPRLPLLIRRIGETVKDIEIRRPDAVVTIDSPDFSFRVAKKLKGSGIPLIHYVAPSVWAWRPGRAAKIARFLDHLLALLPFEPPYFEAVGLGCSFVGHPVLESGAGEADGAAFRGRHGIAPEERLLLVLPGSRRGEIARHLPVFGEAQARIIAEVGPVRTAIATLPHLRPVIAEGTAGWAPAPLIVDAADEKYGAMAAADAALAASGTVSLELAMTGTPAVIAYRMNPLTAWLAKRLVKVPYASIVNLILERGAIPEKLLTDCTPEALADEMTALLGDAQEREGQRRAYEEALEALRPAGGSPSRAAARAVLSAIAGNAPGSSKRVHSVTGQTR